MTLQYTIFIYRNKPGGIACEWSECGGVNGKTKDECLAKIREAFKQNAAEFKKVLIYHEGEKIVDRTNFIQVGGRLQGSAKGVANY